MPLAGTGGVAATAMEAARNGVRATYRARNRQLSDEEVAQMRIDMETAALNALFAHITANATVVGSAAAVAPGTGTAIVGGTVT